VVDRLNIFGHDHKREKFMKINRSIAVLAMLTLGTPLAAQMMVGPRMSDVSGIWHPVVGTGALYEFTKGEGQKTQVEITIVGKEDVNGKPAYWMEISMPDPRSGGNIYVKNLVAPGDTGLISSRMIMQPAGRDPMEMDMNMMKMAGRGMTDTPSDIREKSERVGTESITVPAGTFSCEHYRAKDGTGDAWLSDKVSPWGLVKTQGKKGDEIVLTKILTDAKDHITGTPKKFDPMEMMRNRPGQQGQ
jgi:hypothetical protein